MKQFDLHRFALAFRHYLTTSRQEIVKTFLWLLVGFFLVNIFVTEVVEPGYGDYSKLVGKAVASDMFGASIALLLCVSHIFSNTKDKSNRLNFLMLPASNLEKYVVRFLHATVVMGAVVLAGVVAADVLRMLVAPLWGRPFVSGLSLPSPGSVHLPHLSAGALCLELGFAGMALLHHAIYVLGGTVFRKQPFVLTCAVLFVLAIVGIRLAFVLTMSNSIGPDWLVVYDDHEGMVVRPWAWACVAAVYAATAVLYWLSYKVFCRMQIINNKWLNL